VRGDAGATLLEQWAVRLVAPIPRAVDAITGSVEHAGEGMRRREELEAETVRLHARIETLERELIRLRNVEEERDQLAAALEYTPQVPGRLRPAQVVYIDHSSTLRTLILFCAPAARPWYEAAPRAWSSISCRSRRRSRSATG